MTKLGMRRDPAIRPKRKPRFALKAVSDDHAKELREYNKVRDRLLDLCGGKSELSGNNPTPEIGGQLEPHHITGRIGKRLSDPFNIIILLGKEYWVAQDTMSWESKQALLKYIRPIRLAQGFKEEE